MAMKLNTFDACSVLPDLAKHKNQDGALFAFTNDPRSAGFEIILTLCCQSWGSIVTSKQTQRCPADGICYACIMGLEQCRSPVALCFNRKKSRQKLDQVNHPDKALFDELSLKFNDPTVKVSTPSWEALNTMVISVGINLSDFDPMVNLLFNSCDVWLEGTYSKYLKPRYSVAMRKWNKDTGGSGREITDFHNYCPSPGDLWLAWVYWLDQHQGQNFLLSSMSSGVPMILWSKCGSLSTSSTTGNCNQSKYAKDLQYEVRTTNER